eukprot:1625041-Pyramimonas_sp.AAC.1
MSDGRRRARAEPLGAPPGVRVHVPGGRARHGILELELQLEISLTSRNQSDAGGAGIILLHFTGPSVPITARVHSTTQEVRAHSGDAFDMHALLRSADVLTGRAGTAR